MRNSGGAFSLFTNATIVLALLAIVLSVVLVRAVQRARDRLTVVALSLVLGGALGNLLDRITRSPGFLRGEVVDFVHVGSFPSFNVADSSITIGAILLVIAAFREPDPPDEPGMSAATRPRPIDEWSVARAARPAGQGAEAMSDSPQSPWWCRRRWRGSGSTGRSRCSPAGRGPRCRC